RRGDADRDGAASGVRQHPPAAALQHGPGQRRDRRRWRAGPDVAHNDRATRAGCGAPGARDRARDMFKNKVPSPGFSAAARRSHHRRMRTTSLAALLVCALLTSTASPEPRTPTAEQQREVEAVYQRVLAIKKKLDGERSRAYVAELGGYAA